MGTRRVSRPLIALNLLLAAGVVGTIAIGQPPAARARGDYTMVAGKTTTGSRDAVYVIDATNREMVAIRWDNTKRAFIGIGYRRFDVDAAAAGGR
jgi:hypothetical protein